MSPEIRSDLRALFVGVMVAGFALYAGNWSTNSQKLTDTIENLQRTQALILYRVKKIEPAVPRARNNTELIRRICDKIDMVCNVQNALLVHPSPDPSPSPPKPVPAWGSLFLHDKRLQAGGSLL